MLRLTKKADYGLMALKFLAERYDMPSLSAKDIAEAYGIPPDTRFRDRLKILRLLK